MKPTGTCPLPDVLETLATGTCTDAEVLAHVDGCEACRATVEEIRKDNQYLDGVRTALAASDPAGPADAASAAPEEGSAPLEPALVRGYQIQGELHRGGQGVVYRAVQTRTRRTVAIKTLLGWHGASSRQKERFEREIRIAAGLRHPNIVTVHESGFISDGRYGLVMEFIEGATLDRWSRSLDGERGRDARRRALRQRLGVVSKVCDAVLCAHQRSIVHRDLKPANILVDSASEPHVLDFGIARDIGPEQRTRLTHTGEFAGTLAYASPEQVSGDLSRVDTRSDIYSLGVILYELASGRMPYAVDGSMAEALRNIESTEPEPLSRRSRDPDAPWVDGEVSTIVLKAMAKDPARRYQSVAGLRDDINHYLAGEPIEAKRDSTWYVLRKTAGRHKALLAGAMVVALAVVAGAGVAGYGLVRARKAAAYEAAERARSQSEARAARSAGRFIRQMFPPIDANPGEAATGRYVLAGRARMLTTLKLGALSDDPDEEATARSVVASEIVRGKGLPEAEVLLRVTIASLAMEHGGTHAALAKACHDLADILVQRGNRQPEAERAVRRAIRIRRQLFRSDDPALAVSQHLLARILLAQGDLTGAANACEEAVAALRPAGKPNAADLAAALATRSDIRRALGRSADAETDAREALVLGLQTFVDDDDPFVAECLDRNAELLRAENTSAVDSIFAVPLRAPTKAGIADALSHTAAGLRTHSTTVADCFAHAEGLETVLAIRRSLFGEDHPSVARTAAAIAVDHYMAADFPGTVAALRRLLPLLEARLGRNHLALVPSHELLFECLMDIEDHAMAAAVRQRMVEIWSAQPEPARDELWLANEHRWLALALALGGSFAEAETEYKACLDGLARAGLSDHYLADICNGGLGWVALHLGRTDEAETLTRTALDRYSASVGAPTDQLALLQRHRGHVLIACGHLDDAAPFIDAAIVRFVANSGGETSLVATVLIDAIELAKRRGDTITAEHLSLDLAEARRRVRSPRGDDELFGTR